MRARLLVTGFEPFGAFRVNPSERMVRMLGELPPPGTVVSTRILPVSYRLAFGPVSEALANERFDAALMLGLGAGRASIDFERFGINWRGSPQPDNDGQRIAGEAIDPAGPAAYFTTAPVDELVAACRAAGAPAAVSSHAGTFLCNHVLYQTLRWCDRTNLSCRIAFAHVPLFPEQASAGEPAVSEHAMFSGLAAALARLAS